jgi:protein gp37
MAEHTAIGWTDATWNPTTGCSVVSPGCEHCYARDLSLRRGWTVKPWTAQNAAENVVCHEDRLTKPLSWRAPRRVFVNSMSDLFHEQIPDAFIDKVFAVMALAQRHTFQVLTKRAQRQAAYRITPERWDAARQWLRSQLPKKSLGAWEYVGVVMANQTWPLANVWLGVSAEDQRRWDERVEILGRTRAAVRFVSAEPLLGPIDVGNAFDPADDSPYRPIDWVIIGGESGPHHRPMAVAWAEAIVAQVGTSAAVYVKQDSGPRPGKQGRLSDALWALKQYPPGIPHQETR